MNIVFLATQSIELPARNVVSVYSELDFMAALEVDEAAFGIFPCSNRHVGYAFVRSLRMENIRNPLYCLIYGEGADHTMIAAILDAGADQVEHYPVDPALFEAQIKAMARRGAGNPNPIIEFGNMAFNTTLRQLSADGHLVHITEKESVFLTVLMLAEGRNMSKSKLMDAIYGDCDEPPHEKIIDVFICKLRRKMMAISGGRDFIMTNWGRGYSFVRNGFVPNIRATREGPQRFELEHGPIRKKEGRWPTQEAAE